MQVITVWTARDETSNKKFTWIHETSVHSKLHLLQFELYTIRLKINPWSRRSAYVLIFDRSHKLRANYVIIFVQYFVSFLTVVSIFIGKTSIVEDNCPVSKRWTHQQYQTVYTESCSNSKERSYPDSRTQIIETQDFVNGDMFDQWSTATMKWDDRPVKSAGASISNFLVTSVKFKISRKIEIHKFKLTLRRTFFYF